MLDSHFGQSHSKERFNLNTDGKGLICAPEQRGVRKTTYVRFSVGAIPAETIENRHPLLAPRFRGDKFTSAKAGARKQRGQSKRRSKG